MNNRNRNTWDQMVRAVRKHGWQKAYDITKRARDLSSPGTTSYSLHNAVLKEFERSRTVGHLKNPRGGKFDRCVAEVTRRGGAYNPYAVCNTTLKNARIHRNPSVNIYNEALAADQTFSRELARVFGAKRAGDMRYRRDLWPDDRKLHAAYLRWRRANDRWMKMMRSHRLESA